MNLHVQSEYAGVEVPGATPARSEWHVILDRDTRLQVVERIFDTAVEATLYLAAMRPEIEARQESDPS